jgi:hypothetical protein
VGDSCVHERKHFVFPDQQFASHFPSNEVQDEAKVKSTPASTRTQPLWPYSLSLLSIGPL